VSTKVRSQVEDNAKPVDEPPPGVSRGMIDDGFPKTFKTFTCLLETLPLGLPMPCQLRLVRAVPSLADQNDWS
jgi:hypothetical protein